MVYCFVGICLFISKALRNDTMVIGVMLKERNRRENRERAREDVFLYTDN